LDSKSLLIKARKENKMYTQQEKQEAQQKWKKQADRLGASFDEINFETQLVDVWAGLPDENLTLINDKKSVVRKDNGTPLSVVGTTYEPIPYGKVVTDIENIFEDMSMKFDVRHNLTKGGRRIFSEYRFPEVTYIPNGEGEDITTMRLIIPNSYDGSKRVGFELGGYRLVCKNGMVSGDVHRTIQASHTRGVNFSSVMNEVGLAINSFKNDVIPFWNALANYEVRNPKAALNYISDLIPDNRKKTKKEQNRDNNYSVYGNGLPFKFREKVIEQWEAPKDEVEKPRNLWTMYNAFTNVITHQIEPTNYERAQKMGARVSNQFHKMMGIK
jgi:hypothetical protein